MAVRVTLRKKSSDVPDDFLLGILASVLGVKDEEIDSIRNEDGSLSVYVKDPEAILKLQQVADKHSSLVDIEFGSTSGGGLFSITNAAVKSNWGLALSWCAFVFVMLLLSMVPLIGVLLNVVLSVFYYAFTLFVAHGLLRVELSSESVSSRVRELKFGDVFSGYMGAGFGFWLGFLILYVLSFVVFIALMVVLGGMGALSDMMSHGRMGAGFAGAVLIVVLLVLLFWLWLAYALPLMFSRAIRGVQKPTFESSLKAVLSVFTPSFLKESFSTPYVGIGGMWSVMVTVGIMGFLLTFALIITIPVALLILYWIQLFLSLSVVSYIKKL